MIKIIFTLLAMTVSLVVCQLNITCPRRCEFPKNRAECIECLNEGYRDVASGKAGTFTGNRGLWNKFRPGAYMEWEEDRCWIRKYSCLYLSVFTEFKYCLH